MASLAFDNVACHLRGLGPTGPGPRSHLARDRTGRAGRGHRAVAAAASPRCCCSRPACSRPPRAACSWTTPSRRDRGCRPRSSSRTSACCRGRRSRTTPRSGCGCGTSTAPRSAGARGEALERVGLAEFAAAYPGELSGGMRQRLALARALALDADLLLMDEPLSALDALTREDLQDVLLELWRSRGHTQVLVTHSIDEAVFLGRRVVVLTPAPGPHRRDRRQPRDGHRRTTARPTRSSAEPSSSASCSPPRARSAPRRLRSVARGGRR